MHYYGGANAYKPLIAEDLKRELKATARIPLQFRGFWEDLKRELKASTSGIPQLGLVPFLRISKEN